MSDQQSKEFAVGALKMGRLMSIFMAVAAGLLAFTARLPNEAEQAQLRQTFKEQAIGAQVTSANPVVTVPTAHAVTINMEQADGDAQKRLDYAMERAQSGVTGTRFIFGALAAIAGFSAYSRHKQIKALEAAPN